MDRTLKNYIPGLGIPKDPPRAMTQTTTPPGARVQQTLDGRMVRHAEVKYARRALRDADIWHPDEAPGTVIEK